MEDPFEDSKETTADVAAMLLTSRMNYINSVVLREGGSLRTAWEIAETGASGFRMIGYRDLARHWQDVADLLPTENLEVPRRLVSMYSTLIWCPDVTKLA